MRKPDIFSFFSSAGRVRDVRLITDRCSSRHKSAGYVEFYDARSVPDAVALHGRLLCGFPVCVKPSADARDLRGGRREQMREHSRSFIREPTARESALPTVGWSNRRPIRPMDQHDPPPAQLSTSPPVQKLVSVEELAKMLNPNGLPVQPHPTMAMADVTSGDQNSFGSQQIPLPTSQDVYSGPAGSSSSFTRLYIGSVCFHVSESDLRAIFEPFGNITSLQLQRDPSSGRSRGYGFVEFSSHESAKKALAINGLAVAGRTLKVALASQEGRIISGPGPEAMTSSIPLPGPAGQVRFKRVPLPTTDVHGELDEGRDSGLAINASQRVMLMQQLSRGESFGGKPLPGDTNKLPATTEASKSLILSNMFNPATEPVGFEMELAVDVGDECNAEYGKVTHLHVEVKSHGIVYIRFQALESAVNAQKVLNGRWFGGNRVQASFVSDAQYFKRFPKAPQ